MRLFKANNSNIKGMHLEAPDTSSTTSSSNSSSKCVERHITLIGMHKRPLFEKLCNAADRYEKHMQFDDIYYLYFNVDGQETVVVLNSIGAEHTGNREMSVRKSDAVLLTYASHNPHSFEELSSVVDDFTMRKKYPPVVLICNEDELIEDDNLSMTEQSSTSEGYESDNPGQIKRHHSMEKIRQSQEGLFITKDQGENFLKNLGPEARFISTPVSQFDGTEELIMELLRKLNTTRSTRRRRSTVVDSLKQITLPFQKSKKTREREESNSSTTSDHSPDSSISQSPVDQPSPQSSISSNVPQIEVQQPEETVFPASKAEPISTTCPKSRSIFRRNQVGGSESQRQAAQGSSACSIM